MSLKSISLKIFTVHFFLVLFINGGFAQDFTIDAISSVIINENVAYTSITPNITGTPIGNVVYSLGGNDAGDFSIDSSTGEVSMVGRDYESPIDANTDNVYEVSITATDDDSNTASMSWTVTIDDVTESSSFSIDLISSVIINENVAYTSVTPNISGTPIGNVIYSLGGNDAGDFSIDSSTGEVSMVGRDYESPIDANADNVYEVSITATDDDSNTAIMSWTVTIDDVTESSSFSIDLISSVNINENVAYTSVTPNISGTPIGNVVYSLGGNDAGNFSIDISTGVVSMVGRDYESPVDANADNIYEVSITATDDDSNTAIMSWTVIIDDVTESSSFSIDLISSVNINENVAYTSVTPNISGTPIGNVVYSLGGNDAGNFSIDSSTGEVSMVGRDYESPVDANVDNIYEVSITATDDDSNTAIMSWTVTIDDVTESSSFSIDLISSVNINENVSYLSVTPNITGTPIGNVVYSLGGNDAGDFSIDSSTGEVSMVGRDYESPIDANTDNVYEVSITATDDDSNTASMSWTVTIDDVTESSSFSIDLISSVNINENVAYTSVTPNITGTPIGNVVYSLGGNDAGNFSIDSSTGEVSMIGRDYENPVDTNTDNVYEVSITATDDDSNTASMSWTVTIDDVTESSSFSIDLISNVNINENVAYLSVTPNISGTPIGNVVYSLGGNDAGDFSIDSSTGEVSMIGRDYESPVDANTDNVYEVSITATDDDSNTAIMSWTVIIDDVTESSSFSIDLISNVNINENVAYLSVTPNITGTPIGNVVYSLGGNDAGDFSIDSSTGEVSMIGRDYESPVDANTDNVYEVSITATDDDSNTASMSWTVTIDDVTESSSFSIDLISNVNINENVAYLSVTPNITGTPIGNVVYSLGGNDAGDFSIDSSTGVVSMVGRDYESPVDANTDNVYEVSITATDDDSNTASMSWTVTIDDVTESSSFSIDLISNVNINENVAYLSVTPNITGTPIGNVVYSLGGNDAGDFSIDSSTGVVSMVGRDYESPVDANTDNVYEVSITATDDDSNTANMSWTVTIDDVTESSSFSIDLISSVNINENVAYLSVTPNITGTPIGNVVYSLGGNDAGDFSIDSSTGEVSMVGRDYESPVDTNTDNVYEVSITATDDDSNTAIMSWTVTIDDVTESSSFSIDLISSVSINENVAYTSVTPNITGTPIGNVIYSLGGNDAGDFSIDSSTGEVSMVGRDYESPIDANTDNVYEVSITVTDDDSNTASMSWTVTVENINDNTPVAISDAITVNEGGTATILISEASSVLTNDIDADGDVLTAILQTDVSHGVLILNSDGTFSYTHDDTETTSDNFTYSANDGTIDGNIVSVSITIDAVNDNYPVLSVSNTSVNENHEGTVIEASSSDEDIDDTEFYSISGTDSGLFTINSSTGILTFNTSPDFENPVDNGGNNIYNLTITVTDGIGHTDSEDVTISVLNVTETSSFSIDAISNVQIDENEAYTSVTPNITGSPIGSVLYSLGGADATDFNINSSTGVVTMVGRDYENPVDSDVNNIYEVSITATDSDGNIATISWILTVLAVNEYAPVINVSSTTVNENHIGTVIDASSSDADASDTETYSITGTDSGLFTIDSSTGILTFNTSPDYENPADSGDNNIYNITIIVTDGAGHTDSEDVTVTVENVNDNSPVAVSDAITVNEGGTATSLTTGASSVLTNDSDSDGDAINAILVSNVSNGTLTLNSNGTFIYTHNDSETTNDNFTYRVNDGSTDGNTVSVSITINAVNDNSPVLSVSSTAVNENHTGNVIVASSADIDAGDTGTYSISGTDSGLFTIDSSTGILTFNTSPDYENPADNGGNNVYNITITVTDGAGHTDSENVTVTVLNVIEASNYTINAISNVSIDENTTYTSVTPSITGSPIGNVTYSIGGVDGTDFNINSSTGVVSMVGRDYENPADANGNNVYEISITATDDDGNTATTAWTVTILAVNEFDPVISVGNTSVNENHIGTVVDASSSDNDADDTESYSISGTDSGLFTIDSSTGILTFNSSPDYENPLDNGEDNSYNLTIIVTDGAGHIDSENITIDVSNVNDNSPVAVSDAITVNEGGTATSLTSGASSVLTNDSDADRNDITAILVSNVSNGTLTLNSNGTFIYTHNDSESTNDNFTYRVNDGSTDGNTVSVSITINAVNDNSPVLSVSSTTVNENHTGNVIIASSADIDAGDTGTYSISGTDSGLFTIDSSTGILTFNTSPDYENPADNGGNNVYNITITVTDEVGHTDSESVTVTVLDVTETSSYTIDAISNVSIDENTTYTSVTPNITGSPVGSVVYSLGGTDAEDFSINSSTGVVSMVGRDYENPVDSNINNVYEVGITATDNDGNIATTSWTVTILAVNEYAPVISVSSTSVYENHTGTVIDASSTDADANDTETYSISGTDSGLFTIDSSTGILTFNTSPDYENPIDNGENNVYNLTITVTDEAGHTDSENVTVTVLNVTESSSYTINAISNVSIDENTAYTSVTPNITGSPVGSVVYSLGGTDAADFSINSSTGVVSMVGRDYENPVDSNVNNVYEVSIIATDNDGNIATTSWTVTVLAVNEYAPEISANSTTVNENHTGTVIDASSTDADANDIEIYSITGTDSEFFTIDSSTGILTFNTSPDYENPIDHGENNIYNLTIIVTDGAGHTDSQNISVSVININDNSPIAVSDEIIVVEGGLAASLTSGESSVLFNDSDADGDDITAVLVSDVSNGTLTLNTNGTFIYIHDNSELTYDSFTYTANDGSTNGNTVSVLITITGVNDAPVIDDIPNQTVAEGNSFNTINLDNYITDAETSDENIVWSLNPTPTYFDVEINNRIAYVVPKDEEWNGVEVITFVATDESNASVDDNVRLEVTPINDAPEIIGQNSVSIAEETLTELSLSDLIVYDPDDNYPTGFTLNILSGSDYIVTGTAITPNENVTGVITVHVYVTDDGLAQSNTFDLQVNVVNDNDPPVILDIPNQTINEGSVFNVINLNSYVSDPDNSIDQILWTYTGNTELGVSIDGNTKYATIVIPDEDWFGQETITFTASDGSLTASIDVVLTVSPINDAPVINSQQSLSYDEDEIFTIPYTALNVTDVDNTYPGQHEMTLLNGSNYTFTGRQVTPETNFNGSLTIPLYISDVGSENQTSNTFNLHVTINAINDAPIIESQINTLFTNEDVPIEITIEDISIADVDNEADDFSLIIHSGENYSFNGTTVTPALNYFGILSVDISVSDGQSENSESSVFTLDILVLAQNDAPEANNQSVTTAENQAIDININNLVSDVENGIDLSSLKITTDVINGSTILDSDNGIITYTPSDKYTGTDSFEYEICDTDGACARGIVTIIVSNEAPTGIDDIVEVKEDNSISINVISNDIDPQNNLDYNTLTILSSPENGNVTIQSEGLISYTPEENYSGDDEFEYQVCDEDGYCTSASVYITVTPVNDQPVILTQSTIEINEDNSYTITLNDLSVTDIDNIFPSEFVLDVVSGNNYSIVGNTITPALNYNGELYVNITVDDQELENNISEIYQFLITVNPINDRPEIKDQVTLLTNEDEALTISLTDLTVEDPDNNYPNDFVLVVLEGLNYTVSNNIITPSNNYTGYLYVPVYVSDQSDANDRSKIFSLEVQVVSQNDAPVSNDLNQSTSEDVSIEIDMTDLVTDVDGNIDYSSFENITYPENGELIIDNENYVITYIPDEGYSGDDEFSFRFYDTDEQVSNISYVYISISNEAPNAIDDEVELNEDESVVINVLSNDTDPQNNIDINSLVIVSNPLNGDLLTDSSTGQITYTPISNFSGIDNFRYRIYDDLGYFDDATVTITILAINDRPIAVNDEVETNEDESVDIDVLSNDYDIDSDSDGFVITISEQPLNGYVNIDSDNQIMYTPNENYNGNDSFIYQLCDSDDGCNSAQVSIFIIPVNDKPIAVDDNVTTTSDAEIIIDVVSNDIDIDGNLDITSVSLITEPRYGDYSIESLSGEIKYIPQEGYVGSDSFIYQICDSNGLCATATVSISINLKNVAPNCIDDIVIMNDGEIISFSVLDNDSDINGDYITVIPSEINQLGGFLEEDSNGLFTYTSVYGNYCIEEYFTYVGCDDYGSCDEATVKIIINVADTDNDNIADYIEEQQSDSDGDELPDYEDEDSDNDGISDILEGGVTDICLQDLKDTDNDGIYDYLDEDSDGDGVLDLEEGSVDCDNDNIPNYQDLFDDCAERIDAPDTFSPNGDGVNDYFIIPGISDFEGNEIYIYNRWGGEVFHMKNYNNLWDGKSSKSAIGSAELPQGLYFYVIKLGNLKGVLKGSVYIKR